MAVNNKVNINISAVENLSDKFDNIKKSVGNTTGKLDGFKKKLDKMQPTFQKMAGFGTAAFAGMTAGIVKTTNAAGQLEKTTQNFETTFGKSAENISDFITGFADDFAFVESEMMSGANSIGFQLNAMGDIGKEEGEKITKSLLTASGGLSDFFGEQMSVKQASQAMAKGLAGNRAQLLDMGFNVADEDIKDMAASMGMNTDELTKTQEAFAFTKLIMEQTQGSVKGLTEDTGSYARQQRELRKSIQETKESIGMALLPVMKTVNNTIQPIIQKIADWTQKNPELTKKIVIVTTAVAGLVATLGLVGLAIPPIIAGFTAISGLIGVVGGAISLLLSPITLAIGAITGLIYVFRNGFSEGVKTFKKLGNIIGKYGGFFVRTVVNLGKAWVGFLQDMLENAVKVLGVIVNNFVVFGKNVFKSIKNINWSEAWAGIQEWFGKAMDSIVNFAKKIGGRIKNFFKELLTGEDAQLDTSQIQVEVKKSTDKMFDEYQNVFDKVDFSRTSKALGEIGNDFSNTFGGVSAEVEDTKDVVEGVKGAMGSLGDIAGSTGDKIGNKVGGGAKKAKEETEELKEETFEYNEALKKVSDTAIRLSGFVYKKLGKALSLENAQKSLDRLKGKFQKAFGNNNALISKTENKIKSLKREIGNISKEISNLENKKVGVNTGEKEDLAKRAVEIEKKLSDTEIDNIERYNLKKELRVAKEKAGIEAIEEAREWQAMNETERIIAKAEEERQAIDTEIEQAKERLEKKKEIMKEEEEKLTELQNLKVKYENQYHKLFQENMKEKQISIQKAITAMQKLNALKSGGSSGGSTQGERAGGPDAGSTYKVGEQGPEYSTPSQSGTITPAGNTNNATININMGGVTVSNQADENRLVEKIKQNLSREAKSYNLGIA